jgi:epoxyqueuosine reductase
MTAPLPRLEDRLKAKAHALGFELAGIAPASPADGFDRLQDWLDQGFAGEMGYMERQAEARKHPASILPPVRSVVMVGISYAGVRSQESGVSNNSSPRMTETNPGDQAPLTGKVARYAQGADYHDVLRGKLNELLAWVQQKVPGTQGRGIVDTAPLLERDFARRAGLGWFGKNTMLLNKKIGSYFLLGALLLDLDLATDEPFEANHCGTCTACLDACPTDAFTAPYQLDSRRCISYLTIELRGPIDPDLRPAMGDWVFGCDVCQEVCPWNRKAPPGQEPALQARAELANLDLLELLQLSQDEFRARFKHTALWRAKRRGLLRNAAIALGNLGDGRAIEVLEKAALDEDGVIREAARWALERLARPVKKPSYA